MSKEIYDILVRQWMGVDELEDVQAALEGIKLLPVVSSNLAAVGYDDQRLLLVIAFLDGSVYMYKGVPKDEYEGLMLAYDSHGEYFYDNIRLVYEYERVAG